MKFAHATIMVKNLEESIQFYRDIVSLPTISRFSAGPGMEIAFVGEGETLVELVQNDNLEHINIGTDISLGFSVESLDKTIEFVKESGIHIHSGPFQPNPTTKFFYILDPNGLKIQFIEHR